MQTSRALLLLLCAGAAAVACTATRPRQQGAQSASRAVAFAHGDDGVPYLDGVDGVLAAFDSAPIVALADLHGAVELGAFRNRLLRDPRLPGLVQDVVIEAGNSLYQRVADRYVDGARVPYDSVRMIWNNTTQSPFNTLDESLYAESILQAVRAVNASRPKALRMRVLLADPPIQWDSVRTRADHQAKLAARTRSQVAVLEDSVLARGHRALFIVGGLHVFRRQANVALLPRGPNTAESLLRLHPGSVFVIGVHNGFGGATAIHEPRITALPRESYLPVRGSFLGALVAEQLFAATPGTPEGARPNVLGPGGVPMTGPSVFEGLLLSEVMDGYLYLAPFTELTVAMFDPSRYRANPALVAELDRRQRILSGQPFDTAQLYAQPSSPFLNGRWRGDQNPRIPRRPTPPTGALLPLVEIELARP